MFEIIIGSALIIAAVTLMIFRLKMRDYFSSYMNEQIDKNEKRIKDAASSVSRISKN
jgi:hypothetical protein